MSLFQCIVGILPWASKNSSSVLSSESRAMLCILHSEMLWWDGLAAETPKISFFVNSSPLNQSERRRERSPPLFDDLLEDLDDVDHCLVSSPRVSSESPSFDRPPSVSADGPETSESCSGSWPAAGPLVSPPPSSLWLYWAIFLAKASWVSSSSSRMSSMVRPYHSSCQHHACLWARTITLRRPAGRGGSGFHCTP